MQRVSGRCIELPPSGRSKKLEDVQAKIANQKDASPSPGRVAAVKEITAPISDDVKAAIEDDYQDVPDEWGADNEGEHRVESESELRHTLRDFTASADKKLGAQTDLAQDQLNFLYYIRLLQKTFTKKDFPELYAELQEGAEWMETYRVSLNRGGRRETVEMFRGGLSGLVGGDPNAPRPPRFGF